MTTKQADGCLAMWVYGFVTFLLGCLAMYFAVKYGWIIVN